MKDLAWFDPGGHEMTDESWNAPTARSLGVQLAGDAIDEVDERGHRIIDDTLLILLNADSDAVSFVLPPHQPDQYWEKFLDTMERLPHPEPLLRDGRRYALQPHSLAIFTLRPRQSRASQ